MTEEKQTSKKGFGGIFDGLKRMTFSEEYLKQQAGESDESQQPASEQIQQNPQPSSPVPVSNTAPVIEGKAINTEEVKKKIYDALESINQPGIDFLELWNSAEAMGGSTLVNLQSSFKVLNIASGGKLNIEDIVNSGDFYKKELQRMIGTDISKRRSEREKLVQEQTLTKESLVNEVNGISQQIKELQENLSLKQKELGGIDAKYQPRIAAIDSKVEVGSRALEEVLSVIQGVLEKVPQIKR